MEVRLEQVTKQFVSGGKTTTAVDCIDVTIGSGKLVGFLGPSGCGKTTLLSIIAGIHTLTGGRVLFDGRDVSAEAPEKRGVGMVFQNYALYPHLTVRENIAFPLVNSKEMKKRLADELAALNAAERTALTFKQYVERLVQEAAALVEIGEYLTRKPAELSGGQQQRVAIARAVVKRPSILLLDEPLSNLDARLRLQTRDEIKRIQRRTGITTVFVTHDQEESLTICDEIVIMRDGVLQQQGSPQEVYDYPANRFAAEFLGTPPINLLPGEVRGGALLLAGAQWKAVPEGTPEGNYTVGLRAESLRVGQAAGGFPAVADDITKLGGATTVTARLPGGETLRLFQDLGAPVERGQDIWISALPGATMLFSADGAKVQQW